MVWPCLQGMLYKKKTEEYCLNKSKYLFLFLKLSFRDDIDVLLSALNSFSQSHFWRYETRLEKGREGEEIMSNNKIRSSRIWQYAPGRKYFIRWPNILAIRNSTTLIYSKVIKLYFCAADFLHLSMKLYSSISKILEKISKIARYMILDIPK